MKLFSKISIDDIKTIQVDSGVLLKEFDVENPVFLPENVICATSGGINPVCAPEYYDFGEDVDNAKSAKETKRIRGWNATISFTTLTTSLAAIKLALGVADISGKVLNLRQRLQYAKDFKDIWWVGERADGVIVAIKLIRSLSDSGFSLQTTKKGKGQMSVTLKGHSSFSDIKKVPMEIYVLVENDSPEVPTASLYIYGTPSESGNIGLRNGDSVTYYDGAVLPKLPEWDKETYPYAYVCKNPSSDYHHAIYFTNTPVFVCYDLDADKYSHLYQTETVSYVTYRRPKDFNPDADDVWVYDYAYTDSDGLFDQAFVPIWANVDVERINRRRTNDTYPYTYEYEATGEIAIAASDPIPVGEIVDYNGKIPIYEVRV